MTNAVDSPAVTVQAGQSFDGFFDSYAREVAAIVALTTGDVALAEDATQEAMARAHVVWSRVAVLDRPDLWVITVATNLAIDTPGASAGVRCNWRRTRWRRRATR